MTSRAGSVGGGPRAARRCAGSRRWPRDAAGSARGRGAAGGGGEGHEQGSGGAADGGGVRVQDRGVSGSGTIQHAQEGGVCAFGTTLRVRSGAVGACGGTPARGGRPGRGAIQAAGVRERLRGADGGGAQAWGGVVGGRAAFMHARVSPVSVRARRCLGRCITLRELLVASTGPAMRASAGSDRTTYGCATRGAAPLSAAPRAQRRATDTPWRGARAAPLQFPPWAGLQHRERTGSSALDRPI